MRQQHPPPFPVQPAAPTFSFFPVPGRDEQGRSRFFPATRAREDHVHFLLNFYVVSLFFFCFLFFPLCVLNLLFFVSGQLLFFFDWRVGDPFLPSLLPIWAMTSLQDTEVVIPRLFFFFFQPERAGGYSLFWRDPIEETVGSPPFSGVLLPGPREARRRPLPCW